MKTLHVICLGSLFFLMLPLSAGDWTHWRGSTQSGYSAETGLPGEWSPEGKNLEWQAPYGTRAAPMVMGDKVYLIGRTGTGITLQERVACLSLETGKVIWEHKFNVFLTDIVEHRLGWAQIAGDPETGMVYAHGVQGFLFAFDGATGEVKWRHALTEEYGRISGYGGRTHSPIVVNDMVIMGSSFSSWGAFGRALHRIAAFDKRTGHIRWWYVSPDPMLDTTYSVPVITDIDGQLALVAGFADGSVAAVQVNTGKRIWRQKLAKRGFNTSVVVHNGVVYATHSEENLDSNVMGAIFAIDLKTGEVKWIKKGVGVGYASPAVANDLLFLCSNKANIYCYDTKTGEKLWEFNYGTAARSSPTIADGKIYIPEVAGKFHILKYDRNGAERINETSFFQSNGSPIEIYSSVSIADGRVLFATKDDVFCIASNPKKPTAAKAVTWKTAKGTEAAQLVIEPAETFITAGESQAYKVHAYDAKGNLVGAVNAEFSLEGIKGEIKDGTLSTGSSKVAQAGHVVAKYNGMEIKARLRVFPPLPYHVDFNEMTVGKSPAGWITSPVKSKVAEKDGEIVLHKLADRMAPPFARMRNYIMPPLEVGYTIQSDMYGQSKKRRFWPDMGLINSRYMMRLMGTTKKPVIRLVSWDPMPRIQQDFPFEWKTDTWYTAKFSVDVVDGKGVIRAKVWPRGEAEPAEWTAEMTDPIPNDGGSPGLYGYSTAISETSPGTPVYYDNVKVTKNK